MNKSELIEIMASKANVTKQVAENLLNAFMGTVGDTLSNSGMITLVNFGTFYTSERSARDGHNPQTGEKIRIPSSRVVRFKAGKELKQKVKD